jgi:HlyD family secretion protein
VNRRTFWIAAVLVLAGAAVWMYLGNRAKHRPKPRLLTVERGPVVASVSATGTVVPVIQVEVGSQVSGTIAKLDADFNDMVREGQVIAELEPSLFKASLMMAEANVARAEAALHEAERAYRRAVDLQARGLVSEVDLDVATSSYEQRQAELRQSRASLETARVNLGHTVIRAPITGVVVSRQVDVGQTVAASLQAPKLFVLARDLKQMQVETKIDEADVGRIRPGLSANFTVDAFPDDSFEGTVSQVRLEPVVDQNVVTYTTVIDVPNPDLKLRPGMTANVTIVVDRRVDVLKIPNAALRFRPPEGMGEAGRGGSGEARAAVGAGGAAGARPGGAATGAGGATAARPGGRTGRPDGAGMARAAGGPGMGSGRAARAGAPARSGDGGREQRVFVVGPDGKMAPVRVRTGITDGSFTELLGGDLAEGVKVVVGMETSPGRNDLPTPPGFGPGMGPRR